MTSSNDPARLPARIVRVRHVVEECMRRRAAGERVVDADVASSHGDLMPELAQELAMLALIERARGRARSAAGSATIGLGARVESRNEARIESREGARSDGRGETRVEALQILSFQGYDIDRELHRGGQGVVYLARQRGTRRLVAIKVMHEGPFAGTHDRMRFEREVHLLGRLNHPNIVSIHDSGTAGGSHYFVMDYIAGARLDEWMANVETSKRRNVETNADTQKRGNAETNAKTPRRQNDKTDEPTPFNPQSAIRDPQSLRGSMALFAKICDAVSVAHMHGVIHRDLKPGNIIIDEAGEPRILDFGLAKVVGEEGGDSAAVRDITVTGQFVGSFPWASPEQVEDGAAALDVRTDVYSLGVVLYQMVTGRFPYTTTGGVHEVTNNILAVEPARPSLFNRAVDDEVETIVLKCLQKQRERRYQSAGELARDVRRYLAGEAIEAKRDSLGYVLRKGLRRHRIAVSVAAAFAIVVTAGLIVSLSLWRTTAGALLDTQAAKQKESDARIRAEAEAGKLGAVLDFVRNMLASANPDVAQTRDLTARELLDSAAHQIDAGSLADKPEVEAAVRMTIGWSYLGLAKHDDAERQFAAALQIRERLFRRRSAEVGDILTAIGRLQFERGHLPQSVEILSEAVDILREAHPGDHEDTAGALQMLATTVFSLGRMGQAQGYMRESFEMIERLKGPDAVETAHSKTMMAMLLHNAEQSTLMLREALDTMRRRTGQRSSDTANTTNMLGGILALAGRYDEAEAAYLEGASILREIYGPNHPNVLSTVSALSWMYTVKKDDRAAADVLRDGLDAAREAYGPGTIGYANYVGKLGGALSVTDGPDAAEPYLREALAIFRATGADKHGQAITERTLLAVILHHRGELDEAESLIHEVLAVDESQLPAGHWMRHQATSVLGQILTTRGRFAEAESKLIEGYEGLAASVAARRDVFLYHAAKRLVNHYHAVSAADPTTDVSEKLARWQALCDELEPTIPLEHR